MQTTTIINTQTFLDLSTFVMVQVKGGSFMMGSDAYADEQPIHEVSLADFQIGQYPVTQKL